MTVNSATLEANRTTTTILGNTKRPSLSSGSVAGTAGAGSSTTAINKPTGASIWVVAELSGKFVHLLGGGGYDSEEETFIPIIDALTTTTSIAIPVTAGVDDTTEFEIVTLFDMPARAEGAAVSQYQGRVKIYGCKFSALTENCAEFENCDEVVLSGCWFAANTSGPSVSASFCRKVTIERCLFTAEADVLIDKCDRVVLSSNVQYGSGAITVSDALSCDVEDGYSTGCVSNALRLEQVGHATCSLEVVSNGDATCVYLEDVGKFEVTGTGLVGSGGSDGYGLEIQGSGRYELVGATITGPSGDVLFFDYATTWANLSGGTYGMVEEHAGNAFANSSYNMALVRGKRLFLQDTYLDGRTYARGYLNQGFPTTARTAAGTGAADALQSDSIAAYAGVEIGTTAAGTGVRMPSGAAVPGSMWTCVNRGANTLTVYAPSGGTVDGGASVTIATGKAKVFVSLQGNGGKDFWTVSAT